MELQEIAAISGKGGLFKIGQPTRSGVLVETIDDHKTKMMASADNKISVLKEISIFTTEKEGSIPLSDVLYKIHKEFGEDPGVNKNSSADELKAFMKHVVPEYDTDRVYVSDIKKLVTWYSILYKYAPEALRENPEEAGNQTEDNKKEDTKS